VKADQALLFVTNFLVAFGLGAMAFAFFAPGHWILIHVLCVVTNMANYENIERRIEGR
jgi:hypothetical protein